MEVIVKVQKIEEKDIRLNSMQVWDNRNKERIMTVADWNNESHVISLYGGQRLLKPVYTKRELVEHLNQFGYKECEAELLINN